MSDNKISSGKHALDYKYEEYCDAIRQFATCMEDYLYLYDIPNDRYYISPKAVERFAMPVNYFSDVTETLKQFVYEEDFDMLQEDLGKVASGEKDEHNIEYRWIGKDGEPIWINCRGRAIRDEDGTTIYMYGCVNEIEKNERQIISVD